MSGVQLLLSLRINHYGQTQAKVLYCITVLMVLVFAGLILANTGAPGSCEWLLMVLCEWLWFVRLL